MGYRNNSRDSAGGTKSRLFSFYFVVLFVCLFTAGYALYALNSAVPLYVDSIGKSTSTSGVFNACFTFSACIARICGGHLADRFGRRKIIAFGGLIFAVGSLGYVAATAIPLLMIFRGVQGVGYATMSVGVSTALIDILPPDRLGEGIGISTLASTLAGSIAPSVAVAIVTDIGFEAVFLSTAAVCLVGMGSAAVVCNYESKEPYISQRREVQAAVQDRAQQGLLKRIVWGLLERTAIVPALVFTCFAIGFSATHVFMTLYAVQTGISMPGSYFIASSVCAVFARILGGRFADGKNTLPVVIVGGVIGGVSYLLASMSHALPVYILCGAMFGTGQGLIAPVMNRLAVMHALPQRRGAAAATYSISADIGNGIGGAVWGVAIDLFGFALCFRLVFGWLAGSTVLGTTYLLLNRRRHPAEADAGSDEERLP